MEMKMNALDSPLEALAFNYSSCDALTVIINNIWTWIAVLMAGAISLSWRIKVTATTDYPKPDPVYLCNLESSEMVSLPSSRPEIVSAESASSPVEAPAAHAVESSDGVTKRKFTVYYYEERENECNGEEEFVDGSGHAEMRWLNNNKWERMGKNEMELWYRYQDLTVFNGNVVRLWDDRPKMATLGSGGAMFYSHFKYN